MDLGFWICVFVRISDFFVVFFFFELGFAQIYWVLLILCCCILCWIRGFLCFFCFLLGVSDNEGYYTKVELS